MCWLWEVNTEIVGFLLMADKVRLNLELSKELYDELAKMAEETGTSLSAVARQSFALMRVAQRAKLDGMHLGIARDPAKLDTELVGLL